MDQISSNDIKEAEDNELTTHEPEHEWLSFKLAELDYAVDILRVREIRTWEPSTRVPFAPPYVVGLINLRGAIVPIVDLRSRLNLPTKEYDQETVILIVDVIMDDCTKTIGTVVDAIAEVVQINDSEHQLSAEFDVSIDKEFVTGISEFEGKMLILLNIDTLLSLDI